MKCIALLLFVLLMPLSILVSLLVFLFMGRPIFFKQQRLGKDKREFYVFKFRSMHEQKVTALGRVVRKLGFDEIPQLWNVLLGQMDIVGPRPLTEEDVNRLGWDKPEMSNRWSVKPGITGPAQLMRVCDASLSLQKDLDYAAKKSFWRDMKIVLTSFLVPFKGKGVKK